MQGVQLPTSAKAIAEFVGGKLLGDPQRAVRAIAALSAVEPEQLTFYSDRKYEPYLNRTQGFTVITSEEFATAHRELTFVIVNDPRVAFATLSQAFRPKLPERGISKLAFVTPGTLIGKNSVIHPFVYIGPNVEVGENCEIFPNVTVVANTKIGNGVKIFAGSVIGSDGFGYLEVSGARMEVPQVGCVVIEDNVRVGAKCTIDRATIGETRVGAGTKIDDQVHVGHNSRIGKNCILCGQVGLGGSAVLEDNVILAGQVGIAGHCTIGKGARVGAQSGTSSDLAAGETFFGSPAMPMKEALRLMRYFRRLPKLFEEKNDSSNRSHQS